MQATMTVLDAWQYGDPATVLERKQEMELRKAKACGDCVHKRSAEFRTEVVHFCAFKRHVYGVRCDLYQFKRGG